MCSLYRLAPVINFDSFVNKAIFDAALHQRYIILGDGQQRRAITSIPLCVAACRNAIIENTETPVYDVYDEVVGPESIGETIRTYLSEVIAYYTDQDVRTRYSFLPKGERKCK